ncbi:MAG: 1-acyl-sn-glycerol-3-phosphate acyltransferase [Bradymonadia bacterium]|jgi:1-acyl-sn-glycerol-3-phosphate acyltransferase
MSAPNPIDQHAAPGEAGYLKRRGWLTVSAVLAGMTIAALAVTVVQVLTLGQARRWCQDVIATRCARMILWGIGVKLDVRDGGLLQRRAQTVFIGNHTSTLDFFVVTALGLPGTRAFLARKNSLFLPVGVLSLMLGHFFTVPQTRTEDRRRIFRRAAKRLKASGDSVFLTPEGTRHPDGIGPFNRGSFHLAVDLQAPIQPLFVDIPPRINPGKGLKTRPGTVTVRAYPLIETSDWTVETLPEHIAAVRACYLDWPGGWTEAARSLT